jgi:hypothetical protein
MNRVMFILIECKICDYNAAAVPNSDHYILTTHGTVQLTAGRHTVHTHTMLSYSLFLITAYSTATVQSFPQVLTMDQFRQQGRSLDDSPLDNNLVLVSPSYRQVGQSHRNF